MPPHTTQAVSPASQTTKNIAKNVEMALESHPTSLILPRYASSQSFGTRPTSPRSHKAHFWTSLQRNVFRLFQRFLVYVMWVVVSVFFFLPIFWPILRPFWRILCWVAPTLLAIEVDAGNRTWVYVSKTVVWILLQGFCQYLLQATDGFRNGKDLKAVGLPLTSILFTISCLLTIVGRMQKNTIWLFRTDIVKVGNSFRCADTAVYTDFQNSRIRTPLSLYELRGAWVTDVDIEGGRRILKASEVSHHVIRTSMVTQFVVSRVFKDATNRIFVYCPVAQYRALLLTTVLGLAGVVHVFQDLFRDRKESEIVTSMILWLTLPSITVPALVRIKFGNSATLMHLLRGLLPVQNDVQMWQRLGISAPDLYAALTNAFSAESVVKDTVGLLERRGIGTVKVNNVKEANRLCVKSLLRIGGNYVRVSDGKRFKWFRPNELKGLSEDRIGRGSDWEDNSSAESVKSVVESKTLAQVAPEEEQYGQDGFSLARGTRILRAS